jgi:zinc and cadmium transporter
VNTLLLIVAASLGGSLLSMGVAAAVTFGLPRHWLTRMVSFSAGILLATAFLDLLPEALQGGIEPRPFFSIFLAGLLAFFTVEKLTPWWHEHEGACDDPAHHHLVTAAPALVLGDAVHNLADGAVLAAAFLTDSWFGWVTAMAVIAHEIPHEAGDFALLLSAGWSKRKAFAWHGFANLASLVGGLVGYFWLAQAKDWVAPILILAAASFVYVAVSDLMPWLRRERGSFAWHGAFMALGVALVPVSMRFLHG